MIEKKINVLHVTLYLEIGGLETLITEQSLNRDKEKFSMSVLCLGGYDEKYKNKLEEKGVPVYLIKKKNKLDLFFFKRIAHFLTSKKVHIIHCHSGCFFNSAICGYFAKTPGLLFTAHGLPTETGFKANLENKIASSIASKMIAVSEEIEQYLLHSFPSQKQKISMIINGVNTELFTPVAEESKITAIKEKNGIPPGKNIIGTVGRLDPVKNYSMLIRAFHLLLSTDGENHHLVFIGNGSEREQLRNLARELKINENISFLGVQYDLHALIPIVDIFVLSSISEGTSVSLLEAQSCGIPAVVTDVGGNGKIIQHGYNGLLCPLDDYTTMAKQIVSITKDRDLQKEMKINARKRIQKSYNLISMVKAYEQFYSDLVSIPSLKSSM